MGTANMIRSCLILLNVAAMENHQMESTKLKQW
jgi:hypothetical protein